MCDVLVHLLKKNIANSLGLQLIDSLLEQDLLHTHSKHIFRWWVGATLARV